MAFRTFTDPAGNEWVAYDVVPRPDERRNYDRRSSPAEAREERRKSGDNRRLTIGRQPALASKQGWLCFERDAERRRLSPIPENWERCSPEELQGLFDSARPVKRAATDSADSAESTEKGGGR